MSNWRLDQMARLRMEAQILTQYLPSFTLTYDTSTARVNGAWIGHRGVRYQVRIIVPRGYPDECPTSLVVSPNPLLQFGGTRFPSKASNASHTLGTNSDGHVIICTMRPEHWSANLSLYRLADKALLWLLAYEFHLDSGDTIDTYLPHQPA